MSAALDVKERLFGLQRQLLREWPVLVQIGLSLPGGFGIYPWESLFAEATACVGSKLAAIAEETGPETRLRTDIGPYCILPVKADPVVAKLKMVEIEECAPRGRLWDIDVYTAAGPMDRPYLGLRPRPCLVCGERAHMCRKLGAHPLDDVIAAARIIVNRVGEDKCC